MSNHPNHRRGHGRIQGNGPTWENGNPEAGCNSTHVARSRKKWKKRVCRAERRTGKNWSGYGYVKSRYKVPDLADALEVIYAPSDDAG
jgi:hypothetical protein